MNLYADWYYTEAKNPSDDDTLIKLAEDLGLSGSRFSADLRSEQVQQQLDKEINYSRQLGLNSFPSLALSFKDKLKPIQLDYNRVDLLLTQIETDI